ncbi:hypothetical protein BDW68DRAFT_153599 [Aspergillus falconensis]
MQRLARTSVRAEGLLKSWSTSAGPISLTSRLHSESRTDNLASQGGESKEASKPHSTSEHQKPQQAAKTVAQADEELRQRLEEMSGEGGAAGLEYEDGKPQTMKRSVRNNMFRYI